MKILNIFIILFIQLFISFNFCSAKEKDKLKIVIFSISNISYQELQDKDKNLPSFNYLLSNGSVGLMNIRCAKITNLGSLYLSLNSSSRAVAYNEAGEAFNYNEFYKNFKIQDIYQTRTGKLLEDNNVVNINFEKIKKINSKLDYTIYIGTLGTLLKQHAFSTAVLGNSDIEGELHREIVCLLADENGVVDYGDVSSNILVKDKDSPYGLRLDTEKIFNKFLQLKEKADVIAIEFGDMYRLIRYNDYLSTEKEEILKNRFLQDADILIGRILKNIETSSVLFILICPLPKKNDEESKNMYLSPVVILGKYFKNGLLTSSTTRQKGIITNLDLAPTIFQILNIPSPEYLYGKNILSIYDRNAKEKILSLEQELSKLEIQNTYLLEFLIFCYSFCVILSFIMLLVKNKVLNKISANLLLFASTLTVSMLFQPIFFNNTIFQSIFVLVLLSCVSVILLKIIFRNNLLVFLLIVAITCILISFDTFFGSNLQKSSALGFSISAGARFYGIGNEYMSVLIFSSIIAVSVLLEIFKNKMNFFRIFILIFLSIIFYIIMSPNIGANFGGGITAFFTFSAFYFFIYKKKINFKKILIVFLLIFIISGIFILQDIKKGKEQSHLGKFILQVQNQGISAFSDTVERKLAMNIKLIQYTRWNKILILCLITILLIIFYPIKLLDMIKNEYNNLFFGIYSIIFGSIAGFLFNDSGIIVATIGTTTITITILFFISTKEYLLPKFFNKKNLGAQNIEIMSRLAELDIHLKSEV